MPLLAGCSQVYTEQDFPDINEVPKRPTLVSITDCAAEAAAFQKSYATAR